jgi:hypothetical protein
MSVQIISAARASAPYPWAKFAQWMNQALVSGEISQEEFERILLNGAEPTVTNAVGLVLDVTVPYPGLPDPDHLPDNIDGLEPSVQPIGGSL